MDSSLFHTALLSASELFLNRLIALDPAAPGKLETLSGKVLRIRCDLPAITINLLVDDRRLILLGGDSLDASATVSGKATALATLLLSGDTTSLRDAGVTISGDTAFLASLQKILQALDVDWEYHLSKVIGDIPTQVISDTLNSSGQFARQSAANLRDDIDAWLHEEKKLFPDQAELESFYRAIDALRLRADRLDAWVARLQTSH